MDKITIADVQNAAKKYFSSKNARVVVVGKGSEVLDNREKATINGAKIPMFFYDETGEKTEKPDYSAALSEGLTAVNVVENYIAAIGGKEALEKVESYVMVAGTEMQGMQLALEIKKPPSTNLCRILK